MTDKDILISDLNDISEILNNNGYGGWCVAIRKAVVLLKEQEKKQITLHKKHAITWGRNDEFSMRKLYEAICETLLDEGELIIARTDDHEKVDFVFYVAEGSAKLE